ncbi:putative bifunctional diguanylate cyclase/phosphodiesterase, partial [Quadrisphaera oryzae]
MSSDVLLTAAPAATAVAVAVAALRLSRRRSGPQRCFWVLVGPSAAAWALAALLGRLPHVGDASGGVVSQVAGLGVLVTFLAWAGLAVTGIARLTTAHQTRGNVVRDVLDILLLITAGLSVLWALVLAPAWDRGQVSATAWVTVVVLVVALDVPLTAFHALLRSPERARGVRSALIGLGAVSLGDITSARSLLLGGGGVTPLAVALWGLGWALVLTGVLLEHGRRQSPPAGGGLSRGTVQANGAAAVTVVTTALGVLVDGGPGAPVTFWLSTTALFLVVCRTLLELRRTTHLQRRLELKVEERTRALADSRHRFAALVAHSSDLVIVVDEQRRLSYANPGAARLLGAVPGSTLGRPAAEHLHDDEGPGRPLDALRSMVAAGVDQLELRLALRHTDGHRVEVDAVVTNLLADPDVQGLVINARDVTEALRLERELSDRAFSDALTGLPNRALFRDRLEHALLSRASRGPVKVMYLDLDGFKAVNDTLGHEAGDELLVAVAERLRTVVRQGDTVARLGGDEFAVLLDEGVQPAEALELADRLVRALRDPVTVRGTEVHVGVSVGLASSRTAGRTAEGLMMAADTAMYEAKAAGKGRCAVYTPHMHEALAERVQLEADLRRAVEEGQFRVAYQPLVDMGSGSVSGVEALVRWHHPERGVVGPLTFIPLAESTGLIDAIGAYVLREACQQVAVWRDSVPGAETMRLSVNLSAHQLGDPGLVDLVTGVLSETGLPATSLVLEITESAL